MGTDKTYTLAEWLPHTLSDSEVQRHLDDLGELLKQIVEGGASVNFILPLYASRGTPVLGGQCAPKRCQQEDPCSVRMV